MSTRFLMFLVVIGLLSVLHFMVLLAKATM